MYVCFTKQVVVWELCLNCVLSTYCFFSKNVGSPEKGFCVCFCSAKVQFMPSWQRPSSLGSLPS